MMRLPWTNVFCLAVVKLHLSPLIRFLQQFAVSVEERERLESVERELDSEASNSSVCHLSLLSSESPPWHMRRRPAWPRFCARISGNANRTRLMGARRSLQQVAFEAQLIGPDDNRSQSVGRDVACDASRSSLASALTRELISGQLSSAGQISRPLDPLDMRTRVAHLITSGHDDNSTVARLSRLARSCLQFSSWPKLSSSACCCRRSEQTPA